MNKTQIIIGGLVGGFSIIGILIFIFGWCVITVCETLIEITSFETPEKIPWNEKVEADFAIKNTGNEIAKECYVRWQIGRSFFTNSETFSLNPQEEIEIHLQSSERINDSRGCFGFDKPNLFNSDAWVLCENTDSGRNRNPMEQPCP